MSEKLAVARSHNARVGESTRSSLAERRRNELSTFDPSPSVAPWVNTFRERASLLNERPSDLPGSRRLVERTLDALSQIISSLPSEFGADDRAQFAAHRSDWDKFMNEIDKHGPPGGNGGRNGGGKRDGRSGGGGARGGGGGGDGEGPDGPESADEPQRRRDAAKAEGVFAKLTQVTDRWIKYVTEKAERALPVVAKAAKVVLRESVEVLQSAWNWFKKDGVVVIINVLIGQWKSGPDGPVFA